MAELSKDQLAFIKLHNIPLDRVFDATGFKTKEYQALMKENDCLVAYGVTPCTDKGHTLRTRHGHCAMCNPKYLAFIKRENTSGDVYVAISLKENLTKIGSASDCKERIKNLNGQNYGNINDWKLVGYFHSDTMGADERKIQRLFTPNQIKRPFNKDGKTVYASEIYKINFLTVIDEIKKLGYNFEFLDISLNKSNTINKKLDSDSKPFNQENTLTPKTNTKETDFIDNKPKQKEQTLENNVRATKIHSINEKQNIPPNQPIRISINKDSDKCEILIKNNCEPQIPKNNINQEKEPKTKISRTDIDCRNDNSSSSRTSIIILIISIIVILSYWLLNK